MCLTYTEKGQMLILAVNVHQVFGQGAQQPERYDSPVHTARITPIDIDLAGENQLLFVIVNLVLTQSNTDFVHEIAVEQEDALYSGLAGPGPYHAAIGARAQEKAQRIHDDGLTGPGFPGQHVKAGCQLHFKLLYGGEVGDTKKSEHGNFRNPWLALDLPPDLCATPYASPARA